MKSSAYINKEAYLAFKVLAVIGIFSGGGISFIMLVGFGTELIKGNGFDKDIAGIFAIYALSLILFQWLNYKLSRVNMFASIFENDPDGILQIKVLARALGQDAARIKKELSRFLKLRILINCRIEEASENVILTRGGLDLEKQTVICKNCGAENRIRAGYVCSCSYCGSKIGRGRAVNGKPDQEKIYLDKTKTTLTKLLTGIGLCLLSLWELLLLFCLLWTIIDLLTGKPVTGNTVYDIIMTTLLFGLIWMGVLRLFSDARKVGKLNRLFIKDEDGLVAMSDAAEYLHMKQSRFFFYFYKLIGKKKLLNCSVFSEDPTYILLDNGAKDIRRKYAVCQCRSCGAPSTLRIGFEKNCKYCGAEILRR